MLAHGSVLRWNDLSRVLFPERGYDTEQDGARGVAARQCDDRGALLGCGVREPLQKPDGEWPEKRWGLAPTRALSRDPLAREQARVLRRGDQS